PPGPAEPGEAADAGNFPQVGETLGDCRLISRLGGGTEGQVFLAVQPSLGDRLVVLKVTNCDHDEHLALARLFHTNIVPLLFVQEVPHSKLRVLAMPYLGGASLSTL